MLGQGHWLSLMDYARKNELSLSTLRRYIKAKKVNFKLEEGRYLLWDESESADSEKPLAAPVQTVSPGFNSYVEQFSLQHSDRSVLLDQLKSTQCELQKTKEEVAELKTLIAYYEERLRKTTDS